MRPDGEPRNAVLDRSLHAPDPVREGCRAAAGRRFLDQVAVITGASSGIGAALALALGREGARLSLVGRDPARLEAVANTVRAAAGHVAIHEADLTRDGEIARLRAWVERELGPVDLLIHSAGIIALGPMSSAPVAELDRQYQTNVRAPYLLTQAFLPMLLERQGQIVFVNSSAGLHARAGVGQYAATKHALKAIADSLREEVNGPGIRVLSVFPGRTATPMQAAVHEVEGSVYHPEWLLQPEDVAAVVLNALSLPATAEVTDIHIRPRRK